MIVESALIGATYATYKNMDKILLWLRWRQITYSKNQFTNRLEKTLKILKIERTAYGHIIKIDLPYSYTLSQLEKDLDIFKEGLGYKTILLKNENNIVNMYCVNDYPFNDYKPLQLPPNKLLVSEGLTDPIAVDMNKYPHMLIGGSTGTGKSRVLLLILTNLIKYCNNVDIYLLQVRKNDLGVFQNCLQVKTYSRSLDDVLESLERLDEECKKRERLIDNTKGFYSIEDYNNYNRKLKYIYVVIDEFSFLNVSRGDNKQDKAIKNQCLKYIKNIVNVGRSSGVFLITSLQKPTSDSIPSDIKAQLCTRISLKITDEPASIVILGNGDATKLNERELICKTLDTQQGFTYTITHDIVMENIKDKIIQKQVAPLKNKVVDIMELLDEIN